MNYLLVNNNYHLTFARIAFTKILSNNSADISLIQVPYSLNIDDVDGFKKVYLYRKDCYTSFKSIFFKSVQREQLLRQIKEDFKINSTDVLYVHTDMDFINSLIINHFNKARCEIIQLEDGTATMGIYNKQYSVLKLKDKIRLSLLKYLYDIPLLNFIHIGTATLCIMDDNIFSCLYVMWGKSINRDIKVININHNANICNKREGDRLLILHQSYYLFSATEEECLNLWSDILSGIIDSRPELGIDFKFHPADTIEFKDKFESKFKKYLDDGVFNIIDNSLSAENLDLNQYKYSISINSTGTLYMSMNGVYPIFLAQIAINYFNSKYMRCSLGQFVRYLDDIDITYPKTFDELINILYE